MRWPVALLYGGLKLFGRLPLAWLHRLGVVLGWLIFSFNGRLRYVAQVNIDLVLPQHSALEKHQCVRTTLIETGKSLTEISKIWTAGPKHALNLVKEVRGEHLLNAALAANQGLIMLTPHLGCWELLSYWVAARTPLSIVYRPPRRSALEPLLIKARNAFTIEQVRAEGAGVRTLYRRLQTGGVVGILPDQQPKQGEGVFAPFFGVKALSMVLVSRLAQRTGASVLFSFAERLPDGAGFRIHVLPAPADIASEDLSVACTALNQGIEQCVKLAFTQYQWHYKRYSIRPGTAPNFYWRSD